MTKRKGGGKDSGEEVKITHLCFNISTPSTLLDSV